MNVKKVIDSTKKLLEIAKRDYKHVSYVLVIGAITGALIPFISLFFSSKILDLLIAKDTDTAIKNILIMLLTVVILSLIRKACDQMMEAMKTLIYHSVNKQTVHKSYVMEYEEFEKTETMEAVRRAKQGSNGSGDPADQIFALYGLLTCLVTIVCSFGFILRLFFQQKSAFISNLPLTLGLIGAFALLFFAVTKISTINAKLGNDIAMKNMRFNSLSMYLLNFPYHIETGKDIRLYKMQDLLESKYDEYTSPVMNLYLNYGEKAGFYDGMISFLTQIFAGISFIYVGTQVINKAISIGDILLYTGAITSLVSTINVFINSYNNYAFRFEYINLYEEFINKPNMHYDGTLPIEKRDDKDYEFEFKDVCFQYPGTENLVLNHVNLKLNVGKRFAVVGQNGAGKTTLIKLLCRLYEPTSGQILLNGIDISKYDYEEYTSIFSVVFQDFKLFSLPLDQNIAVSSEVDEEKCWKVIKQLDLEQKVSKMKDGIHTLLYKENGDGVNVSGGEAQKIAIARALYKDAPFVILDEPTAALDPIAEAEIYENFNEMIQDKTAIYISHRMSSCKFCDEIVVFENGSIIQQGSHDELVNQDGLYQELWNAQAQYYA